MSDACWHSCFDGRNDSTAAIGYPVAAVLYTGLVAIIVGAFTAGIMDKAEQWASAPNLKKLPKLFLDRYLPKKALIRGNKIERFFREMISARDSKTLILRDE